MRRLWRALKRHLTCVECGSWDRAFIGKYCFNCMNKPHKAVLPNPIPGLGDER
jgi:hypothetical protein